MDIEETAANPADEVEVTTPEVAETESEEAQTPAEGADEEETQDESLDDLLKLAEGSDESANPDAVDVEYEGKSYKVAPELREAFMRHADYTRKTMTLADERKAIEAQREEVQQLRSVSTEKLQAAAAAHQFQQRIDELKATPLQGLSTEEVNSLRLDLQEAERAQAHWVERIEEVDRKEREFVSQHVAKARETARTEAARVIPNFTDARVAELDSFVVSLGGNPGVTAELVDPVAYQVLHYADIGRKFVERSRQAKQVKAAAEVQPAAEVAGKKASAGQKDLIREADEIPHDEWLKRRNAEVRKAGA